MSRKEDNRNKNEKAKKKNKTPLSALLLLLVALLGGGLGFGITRNNKSSDSNSGTTKKTVNDSSVEAGTKDESKNGEVTITIQEDKVTIDGQTIKDEKELKEYIEKNSNDDVKYKLVEDKAIEATHEWVLKAFEDMNVKLTMEK